MVQIWEWDGEKYEFDLMDADSAELFNRAVATLEEKEKRSKEVMGLGNIIRYSCDMIYEFFDDIFGEGTSQKMFGKAYNLRTCSEAYFDSFIPFVRSQSDEANMYFDRFRQAAQPQLSREQRRHKNHKNKDKR